MAEVVLRNSLTKLLQTMMLFVEMLSKDARGGVIFVDMDAFSFSNICSRGKGGSLIDGKAYCLSVSA